MNPTTTSTSSLSEEEWRKRLSPEQYRILREKGTEYPGTGIYNLHFEQGTYLCAGCGTPLFSSESKFDSHCGWPSFDAALSNGKVAEKRDLSHGMIRTEIVCASCGGHLGHVFPDGPTETGLRYCVNSLSLEFSDKTDTSATQD
jgi:peptide-methionine (R)-S-oxide reductase